MRERLDPAPLAAGLDTLAADWRQTSLRGRLLMLTLLKHLEALETRRYQ